MSEPAKQLTEGQQKAAAFLTRSKPDFSAWREDAAKKEIEAVMATAKIGDRMPDGTIYAGISPNTNRPMFSTPDSSSMTMTFNQAAKYAGQLNEGKNLGHDDWHVPTRDELNVLFQNREKGALKGTFNFADSSSLGTYYWSATPDENYNLFVYLFRDSGPYSGPAYAAGEYSGDRNDRSTVFVRCVR